MCESFWLTVLGGFIAGIIGLILFIIQRRVEQNDKEQSLLYRLYQLIEREIEIRRPEGQTELDIKWTEIKSISLLLKDTELGQDVYRLAQEKDQVGESVSKVLEKIKSKLNEKLVKEIKANAEASQKKK